jgi:uncharacterized protein with von Willebrand factor type A (vWA) domain
MLIKNNKWERSQKESFQQRHEPFQQAVEQGKDKGYDFNGFTQDLFSSLYQVAPQFPDQATPGTNWAKAALDELKNLKEYGDIRKMGTVCDGFQSGLGATILAKNFAKSLPKQDKPNPDDIKKKIESYKDFLEANKDNEKAAGIQQTIDKLQAQQNESEVSWQANQLDEQQIRTAARKAMQQAKDEIKEAEGQVLAFGYGNQPGQDGFNSVEEKLAVAKMLQDNPKLKEIAELAGRFRREARKIQSNKKQPGPDEISDIEIGNDIGRLLPSEVMKLGNQITKLLFYKGYAEKTLLQYKLESKEKKVKGPIVICIDTSGSMLESGKDVFSKALAFALLQIGIDSKRDVEIMHFDTDYRRIDNFTKGKVNPAQLIETCAFFSRGGGTDFYKPLKKALRDIKKDKIYNDADVIFITDGICDLTTEQIKSINVDKKDIGASIFSICLGEKAKVLEQVSDSVDYVSDLADTDSLKEKIFSI